MLYQTRLTIPANTTEDTPVESTCVVTKGIITEVFVTFPPGCCGLVKAAIFHKQFRLWPSSPGEWLVEDDYTFDWPEDFEVIEDPFELRLVGYSEDDTYDHEITARFAMLHSSNPIRNALAAILAPGVIARA